MAGRKNDKWLTTMIAKHGSREAVTAVMQELGRKGGAAGTTGGFAANRELAREAGKIGGRISKRGPSKSKIGTTCVKNQNSLTSSASGGNSKTSSKKKITCRACLQERVEYKDGFCQRDYLNTSLRELVKETEAIDRGEKPNDMVTVTVPGWGHVEDTPEFIIERPTTLFERVFGRRHR